ncbi:unnamed protein product [Darwinula stevensoni]|uniref:Uncharacterized protein n=1 Tax=Darwinula stevensoni TaxID=69355 RepID=A0A7R9AHC0_9CRUS|nr:unnamed protein product [Darwinula stevensoni]CAG0904539.1 unnamed protein product [Darwinula stevensoni]
MSFLKIFGGKKKDAPPTTGDAIQKLRETEEMLIKKQDFLEAKIAQELQNAKKHGTKNKRAAISALKRKKRYEKQLQQIDGTLSTIEMQREALEGANTNTAVLTTMDEAAKALRAAHMHMDVDKVHDMMDDIAEQQEVAREISDAISNPVAFGQDIDEDELEKELEELEQEELDKELIMADTPTMLPNPPTAEPAVPARPSRPVPARRHAEEDDEDMKELAAWAS